MDGMATHAKVMVLKHLLISAIQQTLDNPHSPLQHLGFATRHISYPNLLPVKYEQQQISYHNVL